MRLPHWLRGHHGPLVRVEHINITRPGMEYAAIGIWTRRICRCGECGAVFEASPVPGRWALEDLRSG